VVNVYSITGANMERIGVVCPSNVVSGRVVERQIRKSQVASKHAVALNRCVGDLEAGNDGVVQAVSVEEFWLRDTTITT